MDPLEPPRRGQPHMRAQLQRPQARHPQDVVFGVAFGKQRIENPPRPPATRPVAPGLNRLHRADLFQRSTPYGRPAPIGDGLDVPGVGVAELRDLADADAFRPQVGDVEPRRFGRDQEAFALMSPLSARVFLDPTEDALAVRAVDVRLGGAWSGSW